MNLHQQHETTDAHIPPVQALSQEQLDRDTAQRLQEEEYLNTLGSRSEVYQPALVGQIRVTLVQAKLSRTHSFYGLTRMDPYVRLRFGHRSYQSITAVNGDKTPKWEQTIICPYSQGLDRLHIEILDEKTFTSDQVIAKAQIMLPEVIFTGNTVDDWYPLEDPGTEGSHEGLINIVLSYAEVPTHTVYNPVTAGYYPPAHMEPAVVISEEDVKALKEMFPDFEDDIIRGILEDKGGNKEAAVNALLAMS